jgi:hypothetical protein
MIMLFGYGAGFYFPRESIRRSGWVYKFDKTDRGIWYAASRVILKKEVTFDGYNISCGDWGGHIHDGHDLQLTGHKPEPV